MVDRVHAHTVHGRITWRPRRTSEKRWRQRSAMRAPTRAALGEPRGRPRLLRRGIGLPRRQAARPTGRPAGERRCAARWSPAAAIGAAERTGERRGGRGRRRGVLTECPGQGRGAGSSTVRRGSGAPRGEDGGGTQTASRGRGATDGGRRDLGKEVGELGEGEASQHGGKRQPNMAFAAGLTGEARGDEPGDDWDRRSGGRGAAWCGERGGGRGAA